MLLSFGGPVLVSPANGAVVQSVNQTLTWNPIPGISSYRIVVATKSSDLPTDPNVVPPLSGSVIAVATDPSASFQFSVVQGQTYYWEVEAFNGNFSQYSPWSSIAHFSSPPFPFLSPPIYGLSLPGTPVSNDVADFNNDGKADLIIGDNPGHAALVALGNGDGTFQSAQSVSGPSFAQSVIAADLNGDGAPDAVIDYDSQVYSAMNNGAGTFNAPVKINTGQLTGTETLRTGDINADGKPDLLVDSGSYQVFLGIGDGTFRPLPKIIDPNPLFFTPAGLADVNGDGKLDLIHISSSAISVMLGNGDGTFQQAIMTSLAAPSAQAFEINSVVDINGDGKPDIVGDVGSTQIGVMLGNGDGTFSAGQILDMVHPFAINPFNPKSLVVADINGDGIPDFAIVNSDNTVSIALGHGDGTFASPIDLFDPAGPGNLAVADLNGDGKPDLMVAENSARVSIFLNDSANAITPLGTLSAGVLTITGTSAPDNIHLNLTGGQYVVTENYHTQSFPAGSVNQIFLFGGLGDDTITVTPSVTLGVHIDGGAENDSLVGGAGSDTLTGDGGGDTLVGGAGNDSLIGGGAGDLLRGSGGNDTLWGGWGNDTIFGGPGNNLIFGKAGDDLIYSSAASLDTIFGGVGNDTVHALGTDTFPNNDVESILNS